MAEPPPVVANNPKRPFLAEAQKYGERTRRFAQVYKQIGVSYQ
jgi:hypothetical protein